VVTVNNLISAIEHQVARHPLAIAVRFEGRELSYQELNERSNQLARYLRELGVGPDTVVGIMMDRSLDLMVALLGILKAGGAYMPIDPGYPAQRIRYMVEESLAPVILAEEGRAGAFEDWFHGSVLSFAQGKERWARLPSEDLTDPRNADGPM